MIWPTGKRVYIYMGVLSAFLVVLAFAGCEHSNAKGARADEKVAKASVVTALDANKSLLVTVTSLQNTIKVWQRLATPSAKMKESAARAAAFELETNRLTAMLAARAKADYAKPECNALLDTDFERLCPGIAAGMRERASRDFRRPGGDPGAGGGEDRPIFD